ncbi:intracellular protein transport protein USO1-like [Ostrinia furnacalis]|uniref:intracellular protein transport protein USO1-like n=1 Tax=Ostrinia furnacalis TaxID=93504 RepID=UPI00103BCC9E|nr:intracellular protein transport protein USO1-like [Ostrinia furnacalis]
MADSSEVQALEKISTEVGESQIKITLSSQCIKAQGFLVDKLRKQSERQKEICNFVNSSNLKLQTEIKQAELEIKSLIKAHETIKTSNVELKKEVLLAKERKLEIEERITNGEKKYEDLWMQAKKRYESIPYVQKLLAATNNTQILKDNIVALGNQSQKLSKEYETKKQLLAKLDRERIVKLAEYMVYELPNSVKILQEKSTAINNMTSEIESFLKDHELANNPNVPIPKEKEPVTAENRREITVDDGWLNIYQNNERDTLMMPRLQFINSDFDVLSAKLDEIKIRKVEALNSSSGKRVDHIELVSEISSKRIKKDDEFSIFFNNHRIDSETEKKDDHFSNRRLINILEDVKLDRVDTYNLVSKVQIDKLKGVDMIGRDVAKDNEQELKAGNDKDSEIIEEIDLTKNKSDSNILIPPTQFLDLTQEKIFNNSQQQVEVIVHMSMSEQSPGKLSQTFKNSQEAVSRKKVTFDVPLSQEITSKVCEDEMKEKSLEENEANETVDSQVNISLTSEESYIKIKDMIMRKHNLDLSPQFVYAKNKLMQMNNDEKIITSKFFQPSKASIEKDDDKIVENTEAIEREKTTKECDNEEEPPNKQDIKINEVIENAMDVDDIVVSSPKLKPTPKERSVAGLLFSHGTQGIPDSLNVSISTTGFEEGDADFPQCIDSSLLLSPKADLPMAMGSDNIDVGSQEVPNFLSGLRKTGLSFFGQSATTDTKPDLSGHTQGNNFNFNFGGDEKKARGGLFSMFR